jgi:hypothetical protein
MKTNQLFFILFFLIAIPVVSFGQEKPKLQYTIGFGPSVDLNNMLWGVNFSNELNVRLRKRTSFNAGLSFYQSLGSLEKKLLPPASDGKNREQSSGIFITPSLKYDIIQRPSGFKLSFAAGPSLQLGGDTFLPAYFTGVPPSDYVINKYQRIGVFAELETEWNSKNPNVKNAASISAFTADNGLFYLNAAYKVRFNLGKK